MRPNDGDEKYDPEQDVTYRYSADAGVWVRITPPSRTQAAVRPVTESTSLRGSALPPDCNESSCVVDIRTQTATDPTVLEFIFTHNGKFSSLRVTQSVIVQGGEESVRSIVWKVLNEMHYQELQEAYAQYRGTEEGPEEVSAFIAEIWADKAQEATRDALRKQVDEYVRRKEGEKRTQLRAEAEAYRREIAAFPPALPPAPLRVPNLLPAPRTLTPEDVKRRRQERQNIIREGGFI